MRASALIGRGPHLNQIKSWPALETSLGPGQNILLQAAILIVTLDHLSLGRRNVFPGPFCIISLFKRFYLGQSFHNKTTIVRQIFLTQLERISEDEKEKLSQPWSEQLCPDRSSGPGPGQGWARLTARQESRWLLYGNFGFNIQSRSRVPESEKCVITSIRSAEPSCGFLQVQSFCIGCNCTDHLRLLPSIAKCKM